MKILIAVLSSFYIAATVQAGEIRLEPDRPQIDGPLTVHYKADQDFFSEPDSLWLCLYAFDDQNLYPIAIDIPLDKKGKNVYVGKLNAIPRTAVYLIMRMVSGREFDDNNGRMWDAIVYEGSSPRQGAYFRQALSYLGNVTIHQVRRQPSLELAKELLQRSLEFYPDHLPTKFAYTGVRYDLKEISEEQLYKTMEGLLSLPWDSTNEMHVRSRARALRILHRGDEADSIERNFSRRFPSSDLAEEIERNYCAAARTPEEFRQRIRTFAERFPTSPMAVKMYSDLIAYYLQQGNGDAAIQTLNSYPIPPGVTSSPPPSLLNMLAVNLVHQDSLLKIAQQYIEWAVRATEHSSNDNRPRYIAPNEFRWQQRELRGICYDTWGYVLYRMGRLQDAIDAYKLCEKVLGPFTNGDMLEHISEALMAAGQTHEALDVARRAIASGRAIPQTIARFLSAGDSAVVRRQYIELRQQARPYKFRRLRQEMLNQPLLTVQFRRNDGSTYMLHEVPLVALDGRRRTLNEMKGKVVVLDFWATWCGPCRISMPYMQKLYEKYRDNQDVEILLVNCWERVDDRIAHVKKYLANNPSYTFPVLIDTNDVVVSSFGVTGIPTKFYLDRNGNIQFKEVGFPGADVFVEEASDRIDLLLSSGQ